MIQRDEYEFLTKFKVEAVKSLLDARKAIGDTGDTASEAAKKVKEAGQEIESALSLGKQLAQDLTAAAAGLYTSYRVIDSSIQAFSDYDQALISVAKTSDLADSAVRALGESLQELAIDKGIPVEQYLEVAGVAGQLGVKGAENIRQFTRVVVDLGNASNLAGEEGAQALARMLTVTGEHIGEAERLASVLVRLGNNVAASEREIAMTAQEIALATAPFDMGTTRATALAAAMAEMGLRSELSGTTIGRVFIEMTNAVALGGKELALFAKTIGVTETEFRKLATTDPTEVFMRLLEAMSSQDQQTIVRTMTELNLMNSESAKSLLPLISNYERLSEVMKLASDEAINQTAMQAEVERAEEAFSRVGIRVQEAAKQQRTLLGEALAPILRTMADVALQVFELLNALPEPVQKAILMFTALGPAVIGAVTAIATLRAALTLLTGHMTIASAAGTALGVVVRTLLGPVGLVVGAIAGIVATVGLMSSSVESFEAITSRAESTASSLSAVNDKLHGDYDALYQAHVNVREAVEAGTRAEQAMAVAAVETVRIRIAENERLRTVYLLSLQADADAAARETERMRETLNGDMFRNALSGLAVAQMEARGDWFIGLHQIAQETEEILANLGYEGASEALLNYIREQQSLGHELTAGQLQWLKYHEEVAMAEQKSADLATEVAVLTNTLPSATGELDNAAGAAAALGQAAAGAAAGVAALIAGIPHLAKAQKATADLAQAEKDYQAAISDPKMSQMERDRAADLYAQRQAVITGEYDKQKKAQEELAKLEKEAIGAGLSSKEKAIAKQTAEYEELRKTLIATGASTDDLARAERAHEALLTDINNRKERGGGGGSKETDKLSDQTKRYREETERLTETMFMNGEEIKRQQEYYQLLQSAQDKDKKLTQEQKDAIMALVDARRAAEDELKTAAPALFRALDDAMMSLGDISKVAKDTVSAGMGAWDETVDAVLNKGLRGFDDLKDIVGNAFLSMGNSMIKFGLEVMILKPLLDALSTSLMTMGGGGGIFGFLGGALGLAGGGAGAAAGAAAGVTIPNAKGNVLMQSQIIPLANGDRALMAESGYEGIIPLTRGPDGTLGVNAYGAPGAGRASSPTSITYSPTYQIAAGPGGGGGDNEQAERMMAQLDAHMQAAFSEFLTEQMRNGGLLNPTTKTY